MLKHFIDGWFFFSYLKCLNHTIVSQIVPYSFLHFFIKFRCNCRIVLMRLCEFICRFVVIFPCLKLTKHYLYLQWITNITTLYTVVFIGVVCSSVFLVCIFSNFDKLFISTQYDFIFFLQPDLSKTHTCCYFITKYV